jgi:hypothetical protein
MLGCGQNGNASRHMDHSSPLSMQAGSSAAYGRARAIKANSRRPAVFFIVPTKRTAFLNGATDPAPANASHNPTGLASGWRAISGRISSNSATRAPRRTIHHSGSERMQVQIFREYLRDYLRGQSTAGFFLNDALPCSDRAAVTWRFYAVMVSFCVRYSAYGPLKSSIFPLSKCQIRVATSSTKS